PNTGRSWRLSSRAISIAPRPFWTTTSPECATSTLRRGGTKLGRPTDRPKPAELNPQCHESQTQGRAAPPVRHRRRCPRRTRRLAHPRAPAGTAGDPGFPAWQPLDRRCRYAALLRDVRGAGTRHALFVRLPGTPEQPDAMDRQDDEELYGHAACALQRGSQLWRGAWKRGLLVRFSAEPARRQALHDWLTR